MLHAIARLVVVCLILLLGSTRVCAHDNYVVNQGPQVVSSRNGPGYGPQGLDHGHYAYRARPSIFKFGYRGLLAGGLAGAGAGYLAVREDGDAAVVGVAAGVGALAGAGLGITLGVLDRAGVQSASYISRDLLYGVGFGAVSGAIGGGIAASGTGDGELVLAYAAAGSLAGVALGLIAGIIEGHTRDQVSYESYRGRRLGMSFFPVGSDRRSVGASVAGRF